MDFLNIQANALLEGSTQNINFETATIKWGLKFVDKELNIKEVLLKDNETSYPIGFGDYVNTADYTPSSQYQESSNLSIPMFSKNEDYDKYALLHYLWREHDEIDLDDIVSINNRPYAHFQVTALVESIGVENNLQNHTFSFYVKVPYPEDVIEAVIPELHEGVQANGDVNFDGITNVLDVVQIINYILGNIEFTEEQKIAADINKDGIVNILDAISIVQTLLD